MAWTYPCDSVTELRHIVFVDKRVCTLLSWGAIEHLFDSLGRELFDVFGICFVPLCANENHVVPLFGPADKAFVHEELDDLSTQLDLGAVQWRCHDNAIQLIAFSGEGVLEPYEKLWKGHILVANAWRVDEDDLGAADLLADKLRDIFCRATCMPSRHRRDAPVFITHLVNERAFAITDLTNNEDTLRCRCGRSARLASGPWRCRWLALGTRGRRGWRV